MSEFKGTKGKWRFEPTKKGHLKISSNNWFDFCKVYAAPNIKDKRTEAKYNALLISKAPDLLQEIIDFVETTEEEGSVNLEYFMPRFKQLIKQATEL